MPKVRPAFPLPARTQTPNEDIFFVDGHQPSSPAYRRMYDRAQGDGARLWRLQYLGIEEELERAFRYVTPCGENAKTFSFKFAEVIRGAGNAYEILCRELDGKLFGAGNDLNIYNYLALYIFLKLAPKRVVQALAVGTFPSHPEVIQPFIKLVPWDRASPVLEGHVPDWWDAYRKIKHSNQGLQQSGTLANAMAAVAGLFLVIEATFGFGILSGGYATEPADGSGWTKYGLKTRWSRLFGK